MEAGKTPPNAATRGGPTRPPIRHAPKGAGTATAFPATWPAAAPPCLPAGAARAPCDPRRRLPTREGDRIDRHAVRRCRASEGRLNVQLFPQGTRLGRPQAGPGNRQDRPPGRRRRDGPLRRHDRAVHRGRREELQPGPGFLPADRELPGEGVRRGQNPGRLLQARRPPERGRGAEKPPDRPPDPAAVPRGFPQRGPDRRHRAEPRPGERPRHRRR